MLQQHEDTKVLGTITEGALEKYDAITEAIDMLQKKYDLCMSGLPDLLYSDPMQKITPFMWIKENGKEALDFYTGLFPDSKVLSETPIEGAPGAPGQFVATFTLMGQTFMMIQGGENSMLAAPGPLSLTVPCDTQEEIDTLWAAFSEGGKPNVCGWIMDKYGITWQVVPAKMGELMSGTPEQRGRVIAAFMKMTKFNIAEVEAAYNG
jgi:predicted 3-demethylubiquinone-9 3-methyltransferase (glyoxalase superfamily)